MPSFETSGDWKDEPVSSADYDGGSCPEGEYTVIFEVYENKDEPDTFGVTHYCRMMPGLGSECSDSYWGNYNLKMVANWHNNDMNGASLQDYKPEGDKQGGEKINGISVSYLGAGVSWDYSQGDCERIQQSQNSPPQHGHKWEWRDELVTGDDYSQNTSRELSSIAEYSQEPENGEKMMYLLNRVDFRNRVDYDPAAIDETYAGSWIYY